MKDFIDSTRPQTAAQTATVQTEAEALAIRLLTLSNQDRQERGVIGEQLAQHWLTQLGVRLIAKNVRYTLGELDLIAQVPSSSTAYSSTAFSSSTHSASPSVPTTQRARDVTNGTDVIVFIEVRLRQHGATPSQSPQTSQAGSAQRYGSTLESITPHKQRKWLRAAQTWLQRHYGNHPPICRFDAITIDVYTARSTSQSTLSNPLNDSRFDPSYALCGGQVQMTWHRQVL